MHTCILGRSMKFRSVLSSPKHSTGTRLAFCSIASLMKPAQRAGVEQEARQLTSSWQLSCLARTLHPCFDLQRRLAAALACRGHTFVLRIDHKLLLATKAASVNELSLSSRHQDNGSPLVQGSYKCPSRDLEPAALGYLLLYGLTLTSRVTLS